MCVEAKCIFVVDSIRECTLPFAFPYLPLNELLKPRVFEPTLLQGPRLAFFVEFRTREINLNSLDYFA